MHDRKVQGSQYHKYAKCVHRKLSEGKYDCNCTYLIHLSLISLSLTTQNKQMNLISNSLKPLKHSFPRKEYSTCNFVFKVKLIHEQILPCKFCKNINTHTSIFQNKKTPNWCLLFDYFVYSQLDKSIQAMRCIALHNIIITLFITPCL